MRIKIKVETKRNRTEGNVTSKLQEIEVDKSAGITWVGVQNSFEKNITYNNYVADFILNHKRYKI